MPKSNSKKPSKSRLTLQALLQHVEVQEQRWRQVIEQKVKVFTRAELEEYASQRGLTVSNKAK